MMKSTPELEKEDYHWTIALSLKEDYPRLSRKLTTSSCLEPLMRATTAFSKSPRSSDFTRSMSAVSY